MIYTIIFLFIVYIQTVGQLPFKLAQDFLRKYHLGVSTYFDDFLGHEQNGAGVNLTKDGGAAGFGDGDNGLELIRLDKNGNLEWRKSIKKQFEETEAQCVAQDSLGNFYLFMINYNQDGCIGMRGHIVKEKPLTGKDPTYHDWQGWCNCYAKISSKIFFRLCESVNLLDLRLNLN